MELRSIECFVYSARLGNFTKAANKLYISQSAVSQAIKKLEAELGVELFNRKGNTFTLTFAGRVFLSEASKIIDRTTLLHERMAELKTVKEEMLSFGISTFYSRYFLPDIIDCVEIKYPTIRFNFIEDVSIKLENMVLAGMLDLALVPYPIGHGNLDIIPVRNEIIYLALPKNHILAEEIPNDKPIPLEITAGERYIFLKSSQRFAIQGYALCENAGFTPNVVYESMNWETVDSLVMRGFGVGFVPDVLVSHNNPAKPAYRRIADTNAQRVYALVRKKGRVFSEDVENFISDMPDLLK